VTTRPDPAAARPPDLVERNFTAPEPNRLWVVEFTYVPTWSGTVFTAFVTDVYSRRIVGWRTATSMPTALPLDALEMDLWARGRAGQTVDGLVHHSDAGSQYTSIRYPERLLDADALASIGSVGDSYDNALAESTIGLYKTELVRHEGPGGVLRTSSWPPCPGCTDSTPPDCTPALGPPTADRVRGRLPPSTHRPEATAAGRTEPPLNPGRFSRIREVIPRASDIRSGTVNSSVHPSQPPFPCLS